MFLEEILRRGELDFSRSLEEMHALIHYTFSAGILTIVLLRALSCLPSDLTTDENFE